MNTLSHLLGEDDPFAILGVNPEADPKEIQKARDLRLEDIDYSDLSEEERTREHEKVKQAYETLRNPRHRATLSFYALRTDMGGDEYKREATSILNQPIETGMVLKAADSLLALAPEVKPKDLRYELVPLSQAQTLSGPDESLHVDHSATALRSLQFDV